MIPCTIIYLWYRILIVLSNLSGSLLVSHLWEIEYCLLIEFQACFGSKWEYRGIPIRLDLSFRQIVGSGGCFGYVWSWCHAYLKWCTDLTGVWHPMVLIFLAFRSLSLRSRSYFLWEANHRSYQLYVLSQCFLSYSLILAAFELQTMNRQWRQGAAHSIRSFAESFLIESVHSSVLCPAVAVNIITCFILFLVWRIVTSKVFGSFLMSSQCLSSLCL